MTNQSIACNPMEFINARLACQPIEQAKTSNGIFGRCSSLGAKQLDDLVNACAYDVCIDRNLRCNALVNFVRTCQV